MIWITKALFPSLYLLCHLECHSKWSPRMVLRNLLCPEHHKCGTIHNFTPELIPSPWTPWALEQVLCPTFLLFHHFQATPMSRQISSCLESILHLITASSMDLRTYSFHLELELDPIHSSMRSLHLSATACLHFHFQTLFSPTLRHTCKRIHRGQGGCHISTKILL